MTIQVRPDPQRDVDADVAAAVGIARGFPGIGEPRVFSKEDAERLLEPWLGKGLGLAELPVPRLIVLSGKGDAKPNLDGCAPSCARACRAPPSTTIMLWIERLSTMANTVVVLGLAVVALVLTATALAVAFATRGAMAGNRDIVEVLHFVGANDAFIAREFQTRFLRLGLKGGALGGGLAVLLIARGRLARGLLARLPGRQSARSHVRRLRDRLARLCGGARHRRHRGGRHGASPRASPSAAISRSSTRDRDRGVPRRRPPGGRRPIPT